MEFFLPNTLTQLAILLISVFVVWTVFQLLPFSMRKHVGLVQYAFILTISYGVYLLGNTLFTTSDAVATIEVEQASTTKSELESWQTMVVRKRLHVRTCPGTHCDSLQVLEVGEQLLVDINSNNNNWVKTSEVSQNGYVSSLWLER